LTSNLIKRGFLRLGLAISVPCFAFAAAAWLAFYLQAPPPTRVYTIEVPDKRVVEVSAPDETAALRAAEQWHTGGLRATDHGGVPRVNVPPAWDYDMLGLAAVVAIIGCASLAVSLVLGWVIAGFAHD